MILSIRELGISRELNEQTPLTLGRKGFGADIEIDHEMFSRQHAEIKLEDGQIHVIDKHSKNGVSVNNIRIQPGVWRELHSGDKLNIIGFDIIFTAPAPDNPPPILPSPPPAQRLKPNEERRFSTAGNRNVINETFKALLDAKTPIRIGRASDNDLVC